MKNKLKLGLLITSVTFLLNGCNVNSELDNQSNVITLNNAKKVSNEMFYFLNKNTNDVSKYPKLNFDYNKIVIDMEDSTKQEISDLKNKGIEVFCYISAGSYEDWRSDADTFPENIKGNALDGWAGENWLDISNPTTLNIMEKRIDRAKEKGCDGMDFDNVDGYTNDTGFNLVYTDQLNYNKKLSSYAHYKGMKTILKNDLDQLDDLMNYFDYAVNESCNEYNECDMYKSWTDNGKTVFNIEYSEPLDPYAQSDYFKTYIANQDLDGSKYDKLN